MNNLKKIVVVGNGMTSVKFCQKIVESGLLNSFEIIVIGEEKYLGYDRVHLTDYYTGTSVEDLTLLSSDWYEQNNIRLITGNLVTEIDKRNKQAITQHGDVYAYDILVLATGSSAFVPSMPGIDKTGIFVYRTFEDLDAIKSYVKEARTGIVIGGGLLGLEAAKAIMDDNIQTTVLERNAWLMNRQLDEKGASILQQKLEAQGLRVITNAITVNFEGDDKVTGILCADGTVLKADLFIISAGIKARDELARKAGLEVAQTGGIVVNESMQTSHPDIYAIGECAYAAGMIWGLVAPCYQMAEVLVEQLKGEPKVFTGGDLSTKLKLIGNEVASFGDALGRAGFNSPNTRKQI